MNSRCISTALLLSLLVCVGCSGSGSSDTGSITAEGSFQSAYGFEMDVSEDWVILTRETAEEMFAEGAKRLPKYANKEALAQVNRMVSSGEMEFLMNLESGDASFQDNITVVSGSGVVPESEADIRVGCRDLGNELSKAFGRKVRPSECGAAEIAGRPALFVKFDGIVPGTMSAQYHVGAGRQRFVTITAAYATKRSAAFEAEFQRIMESMRFP